MTEAGQLLFDHLKPVIEGVDSARDSISDLHDTPAGKSVHPFAATKWLAPTVARFSAEYPAIALEIIVESGWRDIGSDHSDAGTHMAGVAAQGMISTPIGGGLLMGTVASPEYLAAHGAPGVPEDLRLHNCIRYRWHSRDVVRPWKFASAAWQVEVAVRGSLIVNDLDPALQSALGGIGIAKLPTDWIAPFVSDGKLVPLLPSWSSRCPNFCLVHPGRRHVPTKLRKLIESLRKQSCIVVEPAAEHEEAPGAPLTHLPLTACRSALGNLPDQKEIVGMKLGRLKAGRFKPRTVMVAALVVSIGIFVLDTGTDVAWTVADLYVVVLLMVFRVTRPRGLLLVASGCVVLTVVSHVLSPGDTWSQAALFNLASELIVNGVAAWILVRVQTAELALNESRDRLLHVTRLTAIGELTASIAHEVNQPLAGVVTNAQACLRWLAARPPNLEEGRQAVERVLRDGKRASNVVHRIRGMAGKSAPEAAPVDINELARDVLALLHSEAELRRTTMEVRLSSGLPMARGDRFQLGQVILNLVLNALEAVDECRTGPRMVEVATGRENATDIRVSIGDSGKGIDRRDLERVFEALYTTKCDGMGLGLAISRSIIEAHGGRLWATQNEPRRAAVFRFTLPVHT